MNIHQIKINPLPPQAFTKETLQKAYSWLLQQSDSVKEMATTQDLLISLYLKAQRNGEASLETSSIQKFKLELKNQVLMLGNSPAPPPASLSADADKPVSATPPPPRQTKLSLLTML